MKTSSKIGLNPSFSGWPSPGITYLAFVFNNGVLIPLLVDDPLRGNRAFSNSNMQGCVLIPLLVDDPLRETLFGTEEYIVS